MNVKQRMNQKVAKALNHQSKNQSGMTLLEVMVAVVILAATAAVMVQGVTTNIKHLADQQTKTFAFWVAQNKMSLVLLDEKWVNTGTTRGTLKMVDRDWTWKMNVVKTAKKTMRRIDIEVFEFENDELASAYLTGFMSKNSD